MSLELSENELKEVARLVLVTLAASANKNYSLLLLKALVGNLASFMATNQYNEGSELSTKTLAHLRAIPEFDESVLPYRLAYFINSLPSSQQLTLARAVFTDV